MDNDVPDNDPDLINLLTFFTNFTSRSTETRFRRIEISARVIVRRENGTASFSYNISIASVFSLYKQDKYYCNEYFLYYILKISLQILNYDFKSIFINKRDKKL